jgi:hypothetical protein
VRLIVSVLSASVLFICGTAEAGLGGDSDSPPPPVVLTLGRSVSTRNAAGGLQRLTSIPADSAFARHGGGAGKKCTVTADRDDFVVSNGDTVPKGTVVTSDYLFVEGIADRLDLIPAVLPDDITQIPSRGPLEAGTRTFSVFCDRSFYDINFRGFIEVPILDPLFDPRSQLTNLLNSLQLQRPVVWQNPVVDTYGGLVTRYPTWLAIEPDAWRVQQSPARYYRGAALRLIARPRDLEFVVDFVPNADKPSPAFRGVVSCVPSVSSTADTVALPAVPDLPEQTEPGVNGPCQWTPPGPGEVTFTARITYEITFAVNEFTEVEDDYVWESNPTTFVTGELRAVNTKP